MKKLIWIMILGIICLTGCTIRPSVPHTGSGEQDDAAVDISEDIAYTADEVEWEYVESNNPIFDTFAIKVREIYDDEYRIVHSSGTDSITVEITSKSDYNHETRDRVESNLKRIAIIYQNVLRDAGESADVYILLVNPEDTELGYCTANSSEVLFSILNY